MNAAPHAAYQFGQFTLSPAEKRLAREGKLVSLAPKVFDTLVLLVENRGRLIGKDELLRALWPHSIVEEVALAHNVSQLRKALGDAAENPRFIETVPKRGYRFIAAVQECLEPQTASVASESGGAEAVSSIRHVRQPRAALRAAVAAVLVLACATAAYFFLSPNGKGVGGGLPAIHSLAVLPFENLSGDKAQEYFADGMTDELITELGTIGALRVVSRTSAMRYKGSHEPLRRIADELKVDAVVEGTVQRSGKRVRITAQLVEASSDRNLWARSYERDLSDVLTLQDRVSRDIAVAIRIKLTPQQRARLSERRAVNPEAHDYYLRGRYWLSGIPTERFASFDDARKGLGYFQKAIAQDPGYAPAYSGIADSMYVLEGAPGFPYEETHQKARDAALKALELDPSLAEAHVSLASIHLDEWDWSSARRELRKALALNPNYAFAHCMYAFYLTSVGRLTDAVNESERAVSLDPFSPDANIALGEELYFARRYDDSLRQLRRGMEMYPGLGIWHWNMAQIYERRKMFAQAYAQYDQSIRLNGETQRAEALERAYKRSGYQGALQQIIQFLQLPKSGPFNLVVLHIYAMRGDDARTMLVLERAYREREPSLPYSLYDPALDHLRGSPRFRQLLRRMGLSSSADSVQAERVSALDSK